MPFLFLLAVLLLPSCLVAEQTPDSAARTDTVTRRPRELQEITVTATPVRRNEPAATNQVSAAEYLRAPAINPYDALRQTAGLVSPSLQERLAPRSDVGPHVEAEPTSWHEIPIEGYRGFEIGPPVPEHSVSGTSWPVETERDGGGL